MRRFTSSIRRPVKRQGAEHYLLITLLSFAASVTLTRLFLELTGYPQLGGGELHIAHVLWGGLLLFFAALIPLLLANRWALTLGAFLGGTGVGLFIDEVGKFITSNNNYFYPLAAPIVYAFFLLTVLLYLRVRRPPAHSPRAELYRAFDALEEVLEHDLDPLERADLEKHLRFVADQKEQPDLARLANELLEFMDSKDLKLSKPRSSFWEIILERGRQFEERWINQTRLKAIVIGGLIALGAVALFNIARVLPVGSPPTTLEATLARFMAQGQVKTATGLNWLLARLVLETSVGILLLSAAGFMLAGREEAGIALGHLSLLLSLTTVDLLIFYFDQFSTIITAAFQFGLLILVSFYRKRYLIRQS